MLRIQHDALRAQRRFRKLTTSLAACGLFIGFASVVGCTQPAETEQQQIDEEQADVDAGGQ